MNDFYIFYETRGWNGLILTAEKRYKISDLQVGCHASDIIRWMPTRMTIVLRVFMEKVKLRTDDEI